MKVVGAKDAAPWLYKGKPFTVDMALEEDSGFVYKITNCITNQIYVGKKILWSKRRLPPLKGKKRKRIVIKKSDWPSYFGSSDYLKEDIAKYGIDNFKREILLFGKSRSECNFAELVVQILWDVLHAQLPNGERQYINANIDRTYYATNTPSVSEIMERIQCT